MYASCGFCPDSQTILTRRTIRGGATQYVHQCLTCGNACGNAIGKAAVLAEMGTLEIQEFDPGIETTYRAEQQSAYLAERAASKTKWFDWYDQYLASPKWAATRDKVLRRAGGVCEGCGDMPPNQVHHLTYDNVGDEFLFELVALCDVCHERVHEDRSGDEKQGKADD